MTLQPDSAFFHTIAGGLAAHLDKEYGEYLLADDCFTAKDKNALLGSVVLLEGGAWGYVPLKPEAGLPLVAGGHAAGQSETRVSRRQERFAHSVSTTQSRDPPLRPGLNCVHAHTDPISLGSQPGFVTRFSEKRVSSNRPPGLSRSSQPAPLLSPHLLLGGELSDRETSGRAAATVPADACGQRRIRSRTRKLPILPDRWSTGHSQCPGRPLASWHAHTPNPA